MSPEQPATPDTPPADPDQSGTGASRSEGDPVARDRTPPVGEPDPSVNRSGSGGSGGSADPREEGSSGRSMDDLLRRAR
jgi:hypothetical protein